LADLGRAISLDPEEDWPHYLRGLAPARRGESGEAAGQLAIAIDLVSAPSKRARLRRKAL